MSMTIGGKIAPGNRKIIFALTAAWIPYARGDKIKEPTESLVFLEGTIFQIIP